MQCWRALAVHVRNAVRRGDPLLVIGKLKTEEWTKDDARYSRIVLEAIAVGHDLNRGVSSFRKTPRAAERRAAEGGPPSDEAGTTPEAHEAGVGEGGLAEVS